jgi:hypothetical protein
MIKRLFTEIDIASLVFFRVLFGILAFADIMGLWTYYHLWEGDFNPHKFQFKYYGFEWVQPLPEPFMSIFFLLLLSAAVLIAIGYKYRASAIALFFGFTYVFLLEKTHYLNHGYLFCWLSFVMIFLPANRDFSKDVALDTSLHRRTIPYYNIFILQFLMAVVYFFGGLAKINSDWLLEAMPLQMWIGYKSEMPILGWLWQQEITAFVMAWSGMLLDLLIVFFLFFRRTRLIALFFILSFHIINTILFKIGIFPWLSIGLTLLFFPPMRPHLWIDWLGNKLKVVKRIQIWWQEKISTSKNVKQETWGEIFSSENRVFSPISSFKKKAILVAIGLLILIHCTLPLRQHLYPGPTAWTEEGHRYSWRMMLRQKVAYGTFIIKSSDWEKERRINPSEFLSKKQARKMRTHPDMILQFAHFLRDKYEATGAKNIEVYAKIKSKLNGRDYQTYVDEKVDLAKIEWSYFEHSDWIMEFEDTEIKK